MKRLPVCLVSLAILGAPAAARAQACCGGPTAFAPARLAPHEDVLVGLQVRATGNVGSFDPRRRFVGVPAGVAEADLEQDLIAAARVLHHGQLSLVLPMVETVRKVPGRAEAGGGLGDVQLAARWDFTTAGEHPVLPGIALVFGGVLPTGRAPEAATQALATDATGTGAVQLSPALALEQTFGPWLVSALGSASWKSAREVGHLRAQTGVGFAATITGAYVWKPSKVVLSLSATYAAELPARIDGEAVAQSGRASTRVGVSAGVPFAGAWRISGTVFGDLPARFLGANQPAGVGGAAVLARAFY